jgi:hypothetical protein
MWKMTLIIMSGLVLLSLGSLYIGPKVFSSYERSLDETIAQSQTDQVSPEVAKAIQKRARFRKVRLAFSSFDLMAGFTNQELEAISSISLTFPFFYLLACFWLILGLKKPKRD